MNCKRFASPVPSFADQMSRLVSSVVPNVWTGLPYVGRSGLWSGRTYGVSTRSLIPHSFILLSSVL